MTSVRKAEERQREKLRFVPVWPVVAAFLAVALLVWLFSR
jgi:type VI protein secretion system component VasF